MRILLINKNPVVSQLLQYAIKDTSHTCEQNESFESIDNGYDLVIVDEYFFDNDIYLTHENRPFIILLSKHLVDGFTNTYSQTVIMKKPFLPIELKSVINSFDSEQKTSILYKKEINKIQQLLDCNKDSSDIGKEVENEVIGDLDFIGNEKEHKDNVSYVFDKNSKTKEKELIDAILSMKPKKLKKFLKNANIKLNIEIKEH